MLNSDLIPNGSETTHPAFIVQDTEISKIYVSKYQNTVYNNRAYSLPGVAPSATFKEVDAYSWAENKGDGWHVMTNAEWAAIALWCVKNGTLPHGNSNKGKSYRFPHEHGIYSSNYNISTLTGTGPVTWSHDHTIAGIYDLSGNYSEFIAGVNITFGIISIIPNNDAALGSQIDKTRDSTVWRRIADDGSLFEKGEAGKTAIRYGPTNNNDYHIMLQTGATSGGTPSSEFSGIALHAGLSVPDILKQLALYPASPAEAYTDLDGVARVSIRSSNPMNFVRGWGYDGQK